MSVQSSFPDGWNWERYRSYLRTPRWYWKRWGALQLAHHECARCGDSGTLHVHHVTYERLGDENIETDLEVLCRACHHQRHALERIVRRLASQAPR